MLAGVELAAGLIESQLGSASPLFAHEDSRSRIHIRGARALGFDEVIRMNAPMQKPAGGNAATSSEAEMARALVEHLAAAGRRSTAEVLHELRRAFPDSPLEVRVRALGALRSV
jgi:hypothetical protein